MFKIGDIVQIINGGCMYTTYYEAYDYFNLINYMCKNKLKFLAVSENELYNDNFKWVIVGIAYHSHSNRKIFCLMSPNLHKYIVIGEKGIMLHTKFNQHQTDIIRKKMINYKINSIPKKTNKELDILRKKLEITIY